MISLEDNTLIEKYHSAEFATTLRLLRKILGVCFGESYLGFFRSFHQIVEILDRTEDFEIKTISAQLISGLLGNIGIPQNFRTEFLGGDGCIKKLIAITYSYAEHVNSVNKVE